MLMLTLTNDKQMRGQTVTLETVRGNPQANVLLILSYNDSDVITPLERAGVVDLMNASSVAVDVEYMDAISNPKGSNGYEAWSKAMALKMGEDNPYNIVICADDEALTFVEDHHSDIFANMPVVFFGVNDFDHARTAAQSGYATGFVEQGYVSETIKLAKGLRPNATKALVIVDSTPSGVGDRAQFEESTGALGGLDVEYVNASGISRDKLASRIGAAGDDTLVFLLDAFTDVSGNTYTRDASARFVAEASKQPVFGIATGGVGNGLLCAGFTDPERDGQRAAETSIKVLNGTSPGNIALDTEGTGGFVFDADVLGKFGIPMNSIPAGAAVINESSFTWDSVRGMLLPVGLILVGVLCILGFAIMGYRRSIRDTREIIAQRNDLQHRFYHDQLTDQANAQWFNEFTGDPERAEALKSIVAIDFVDFGDINDAYGRAAGDEVILQFSKRFDGLDKLFLVRSMGAEFLIGFDHTVERDGKDLEEIRQLLEEPVKVGDSYVDVDAHIGVANREGGRSVSDLVTGVDLAVREAKKAGSGYSLVYFTDSMKREMEEKIEITALLKQSIKDMSFVVLFQPQVDPKANEVCGYEALVRMKGDAFYPGQFIPVAEMSGMVVEIDRIVTEKVVHQLATWRKRHKRLVPVSINYSAAQLRDESYVDFLLGLLEEHDVPPSLIKIEITESMLMDDKAKADELFARLKAEGITMALDDFGTGYTSLSRVATIPASMVKIDKSLVDAYAIPGQEGPLDNLVRFVHGIGKSVVAEGVETTEQLDICNKLGVDIIQGYYYSPPLLPERACQFRPSVAEK